MRLALARERSTPTFKHAETGAENGDEGDVGSGGLGGVGVSEGCFGLLVTGVRMPGFGKTGQRTMMSGRWYK